MNELLGIGWYMWLFLCIWLIPKVCIANFMFIVIKGRRYVLHFPVYIGSLALFATCILNHPYR